MIGDIYLLTIATIGMTLGGFTGLISAFRAAGRKWLPQERAGMKLLFEHSLGAVFFGILPFPIFYTFGQGRFVWLVSSTFLTCFLLFEFVYNAVQVVRMTKAGTPPRRPLPLLIHFFPFTLAALILQVVNLFHWQEAWPYFWGSFLVTTTSSSSILSFYFLSWRWMLVGRIVLKKVKQPKISGANPSAICDSIIFRIFVYPIFIYYFICQTGLLTSDVSHNYQQGHIKSLHLLIK